MTKYTFRFLRGLGASALALSLLQLGCSIDDTGNRNAAASAADDAECTKIEGADIGVVGLEVTAGATTMRFTSWAPKADSLGEYVGFTGIANGEVEIHIKAGTDSFKAHGSSWEHPNGNSGSSAPGISNVEVCECGDLPPPANEGEDECNDPDGCDNEGDEPPYVE